MKPLPWLRLYTEMVDDEKIRLLAFEDRWHYVALLCCKGAGLLDAGDRIELLRRKLGVKLGLAARELEAAANRLAEVGLIDAETFQPIGWEGRQFASDTDPTAADRKRRQREREREGGGTDASRVTVTEVTRTDTETETEEETEKKKPARKRAVEGEAFPTPEWVPRELWLDWLQVRRKLRAPATDRALALALRDLTDFRAAGEDPAAVLELAISRGWRGLFRTNRGNNHGTGFNGGRESEAARVERINREHDERERRESGGH